MIYEGVEIAVEFGVEFDFKIIQETKHSIRNCLDEIGVVWKVFEVIEVCLYLQKLIIQIHIQLVDQSLVEILQLFFLNEVINRVDNHILQVRDVFYLVDGEVFFIVIKSSEHLLIVEYFEMRKIIPNVILHISKHVLNLVINVVMQSPARNLLF